MCAKRTKRIWMLGDTVQFRKRRATISMIVLNGIWVRYPDGTEEVVILPDEEADLKWVASNPTFGGDC